MTEELLTEIRDYLKVIADCLQKQPVIPFNSVPLVADCPTTLHVWLDEWRTTYKKPSVSTSTHSIIEKDIRMYIKPNLPDLPLNQFDGLQIQKFLMGIEMSRTRKSVHDTLNMALKDAVNLKLVKDNPMQGVKIPVHHRKRGEALSQQEEVQFLENIKGHKTEAYFKTLLYTGCRRNEILMLERADVDHENGLMHIRGTKTKGSNRVIPLFGIVEAILSVTMRAKGQKRYFEFTPDYVTKTFKKFCPNHKLHDLRHTFASRCLDAGIPLKVVQMWLGHAQIETTADIYTHVSKELHAEEADKLNRYLAGH